MYCFSLLLVLVQVPLWVRARTSCLQRFQSGRENFVLDAKAAVLDGATFLAAPAARGTDACLEACCREPQCTTVLLERKAEEDSSCFLFNCVYKQEFVCSFVPLENFATFILTPVYQKYLGSAALSAVAGRDVVVQPGQQVELSGVESHAGKRGPITVYKWSQLEGNASVIIQETLLKDQVRLSNLWPGRYSFQLSVTDSAGQSEEAQVSVLVLSPEQTSHYCRAPHEVGLCRGAFARWHYSAAAGQCERFTFGGCKGNRNNYISKEECSLACSAVSASSERSVSMTTKEVCGAPCRQDQFVCANGCCLDRSLECDHMPQCSDQSDETSCARLNQTFSRLLNIDVSQQKAGCTEPPRTGPCRASHTRWYYDPLTTRCHRFTYGGCDDNDNNFELEATCSQTCAGVTERQVYARGMFERYEDPSDEHELTESGSIAVAVVLAVAILCVLAVLAYCFLRSRKSRPPPPRPASTSPPEEHSLVAKPV